MNADPDRKGSQVARPPACTEIALKRRDGVTVANAIVDHADARHLSQWQWRLSSEGYAVRSETHQGTKRTIYLHRCVAGTPAGSVTDHINGDRLDNRRANLRTATPSQNNANSRDRRRSGRYRGVYWHRQANRWMSQISIAGRVHHLGLFDDPKEAARAYDVAARATYGAFARTNGMP